MGVVSLGAPFALSLTHHFPGGIPGPTHPLCPTCPLVQRQEGTGKGEGGRVEAAGAWLRLFPVSLCDLSKPLTVSICGSLLDLELKYKGPGPESFHSGCLDLLQMKLPYGREGEA